MSRTSTRQTGRSVHKGTSTKNGTRAGKTFELIVLGSGGGPLETDCSGYLVKPLRRKWEDGILALEGGSGIGALSTLLSLHPPEELFPSLAFPAEYNSPILKAAYVFSFLTCYLLTHAHLDHALSLILLSGSIPPRRETTAPAVRTPVYATKETLSKLALAYGGTLWPELGKWEENGGKGRKRRKLGKEEPGNEPGVMFCPVTASKTHRPIHPTLPITSLTFPVAHGCTSHGLYESSAMFIRYDPSSMERKPIDGEDGGSEFLFFGDVESDYRAEGEEEVGKEIGLQAKELNKVVWEEAAKSWKEGRLTGIFIECSYDSSRPAHLMFGHLSPPGLYHELRTLASLVSDTIRPLDGLTIYVTHIKEYLVPHPSGKSAYEVILSELDALETGPLGNLGVNFRTIKKGDRVLL